MSVTDLKTFSIATVSIGSLEIIEVIPEISIVTKLLFQIIVSTLTIIYLYRKLKFQRHEQKKDK